MPDGKACDILGTRWENRLLRSSALQALGVSLHHRLLILGNTHHYQKSTLIADHLWGRTSAAEGIANSPWLFNYTANESTVLSRRSLVLSHSVLKYPFLRAWLNKLSIAIAVRANLVMLGMARERRILRVRAVVTDQSQPFKLFTGRARGVPTSKSPTPPGRKFRSLETLRRKSRGVL